MNTKIEDIATEAAKEWCGPTGRYSGMCAARHAVCRAIRLFIADVADRATDETWEESICAVAHEWGVTGE